MSSQGCCLACQVTQDNQWTDLSIYFLLGQLTFHSLQLLNSEWKIMSEMNISDTFHSLHPLVCGIHTCQMHVFFFFFFFFFFQKSELTEEAKEDCLILILKFSCCWQILNSFFLSCRRQAHLCILANNCDEAMYVKLVEALCAEHNINLLKVSDIKFSLQWECSSLTFLILYVNTAVVKITAKIFLQPCYFVNILWFFLIKVSLT